MVEPEKPAWKQIVAYFGEQVLGEDGTLDRKKLSAIVFRDLEKRKKLESFTHPQIAVEFIKQTEEITSRDPNAIIQVVIPLLIELNLQYMFHKLLLVHTPREIQIERLALRDGISKEEAANMLLAQLPIDEKRGYTDFIINNENSLEETREQVERLWETLQQIQSNPATRAG